MEFELEKSLWENNICTKVEVKKFLNDSLAPWEFRSVSKSSAVDLIEESGLPIIGQQSIHEFYAEDKFYFWICSSCFVAGQELLDIPDHLSSRNHRLTYIRRFYPIYEPNSNLPAKAFATKLNQITAEIGTLDYDSLPKVCQLKCDPVEAAARVGIEIDDDEESSNHDEDLRNHDEELGNHDEELGNHDEDFGNRDEDLRNHVEDLRNREKQAGNHEEDVGNHDEHLRNHDEEIRNHDEHTSNLDEHVTSDQNVDEIVRESLSDILQSEYSANTSPVTLHDEQMIHHDEEIIKNLLNDLLNSVAPSPEVIKHDELMRFDEEPISDDELTFFDEEMSNLDETITNCDERSTSLDMEEGEISETVEGDVQELLDDLVNLVDSGITMVPSTDIFPSKTGAQACSKLGKKLQYGLTILVRSKFEPIGLTDIPHDIHKQFATCRQKIVGLDQVAQVCSSDFPACKWRSYFCRICPSWQPDHKIVNHMLSSSHRLRCRMAGITGHSFLKQITHRLKQRVDAGYLETFWPGYSRPKRRKPHPTQVVPEKKAKISKNNYRVVENMESLRKCLEKHEYNTNTTKRIINRFYDNIAKELDLGLARWKTWCEDRCLNRYKATEIDFGNFLAFLFETNSVLLEQKRKGKSTRVSTLNVGDPIEILMDSGIRTLGRKQLPIAEQAAIDSEKRPLVSVESIVIVRDMEENSNWYCFLCKLCAVCVKKEEICDHLLSDKHRLFFLTKHNSSSLFNAFLASGKREVMDCLMSVYDVTGKRPIICKETSCCLSAKAKKQLWPESERIKSCDLERSSSPKKGGRKLPSPSKPITVTKKKQKAEWSPIRTTKLNSSGLVVTVSDASKSKAEKSESHSSNEKPRSEESFIIVDEISGDDEPIVEDISDDDEVEILIPVKADKCNVPTFVEIDGELVNQKDIPKPGLTEHGKSKEKTQLVDQQKLTTTTFSRKQTDVKQKTAAKPKGTGKNQATVDLKKSETKKHISNSHRSLSSRTTQKVESCRDRRVRSPHRRKDKSTSRLEERSRSKQNESCTSRQKERPTGRQKERSNSRQKEKSTRNQKDKYTVTLKIKDSEVVPPVGANIVGALKSVPFSTAELITHLIQQQQQAISCSPEIKYQISKMKSTDILRKRVNLFSKIVASKCEGHGSPPPSIVQSSVDPLIGLEYIYDFKVNDSTLGSSTGTIIPCFFCKMCGWIRQSRKLLDHLCSVKHQLLTLSANDESSYTKEIERKLQDGTFSDVDIMWMQNLLLKHAKELEHKRGRAKFIQPLTVMLKVENETKLLIPSIWYGDEGTLEEPSSISCTDKKVLADVKVLMCRNKGTIGPPKSSKPMVSPAKSLPSPKKPSRKESSRGFACIPKIGSSIPSVSTWDHQTEVFLAKISPPMVDEKRKITSAAKTVKLAFHRTEPVIRLPTIRIIPPSMQQNRHVTTSTWTAPSDPKNDGNLHSRKPFNLNLSQQPVSSSVSKPVKPVPPMVSPSDVVKSKAIREDSNQEQIEAVKIETVQNISFPKEVLTLPSKSKHVSKPTKPMQPKSIPEKSKVAEDSSKKPLEDMKIKSYPRQMPTSERSRSTISQMPAEPYEAKVQPVSAHLSPKMIAQEELKKSSSNSSVPKTPLMSTITDAGGPSTSSEKNSTTQLLKAYFDAKDRDDLSMEDILLKILLKEREKQQKQEEQQRDLLALVAQSLISDEGNSQSPPPSPSSDEFSATVHPPNTDSSKSLSALMSHFQSETTPSSHVEKPATQTDLAKLFVPEYSGRNPTRPDCNPSFPMTSFDKQTASVTDLGALSSSFLPIATQTINFNRFIQTSPVAADTRTRVVFPPSSFIPKTPTTEAKGHTTQVNTNSSKSMPHSLSGAHLLPDDLAKIQENLKLLEKKVLTNKTGSRVQVTSSATGSSHAQSTDIRNVHLQQNLSNSGTVAAFLKMQNKPAPSLPSPTLTSSKGSKAYIPSLFDMPILTPPKPSQSRKRTNQNPSSSTIQKQMRQSHKPSEFIQAHVQIKQIEGKQKQGVSQTSSQVVHQSITPSEYFQMPGMYKFKYN